MWLALQPMHALSEANPAFADYAKLYKKHNLTPFYLYEAATGPIGEDGLGSLVIYKPEIRALDNPTDLFCPIQFRL